MPSMRRTRKVLFIAISSPPTSLLPRVATPKFSTSAWQRSPGSASADADADAEETLSGDCEELCLTRPGMMLGTMTYMSPEQVRASEVDARSDLFSFGAVLYEMATGWAPFDGSKLGSDLRSHPLSGPATPISQLSPHLPLGLQRHHPQGAGKDRNRRYQSAAEIRTDLQGLLRNSGAASGVAVCRWLVTPVPRKRVSRASRCEICIVLVSRC